jgi:hypothetical protein
MPVCSVFLAFSPFLPSFLAEQKTENMSVTIATKLSRDKPKKKYYFEWAKKAGQRMVANIFTYAKPGDQI